MSATKEETFPRTNKLPTQSPLFWVEQKDRYLRQLLIRDIEEITGRRLCVYFANPYEKGADIDGRDVSFFAELLGDCAGCEVDLLLQTPGGYTSATESVLSLVRSTVGKFRAVVPNFAKSNGTLLCLAAESILMGASSELGPIEPLVNNVPCSILIQPQVAQQNFPLHMHAVWALEQSRTIAKKLLSAGMMNGRNQADIDQTVHKLSSRDVYFDHGSVIDHAEAMSLGLNVQYLPVTDELWKKLWLLYCMYDFDCRKAGYLKVFEGRARSTAIALPSKLS